MKLRKVLIINRAPFERLDLNLVKGDIFVLSGINGTGKTTVLSYVADALYELAKQGFHNEFSDKRDKFYRISSGIYAINKGLSSIVYFRFEHNEEIYDYIDVMGECTKEQLVDMLGTETKIDFQTVMKDLNAKKVVKKWSLNSKKIIKNLFNNGIYTYFPAYRYEQPSYLNDPYMIELKFRKETGFNGYLVNPIEVTSDLDNITNWLMDIVLDAVVYEGQSLVTLTQINEVFSELLMTKVGEPTRIGIGPRNFGATRIQIIRQKDAQQVYPTVFGMSSGELSQMCMFVELIKQADRLGYSCSNVTGIVIVDEIEKHLHMIMQKETLPKLLKLFPNIQFIVSSHSPFFNMGLEDWVPSKYKLFDMDNRGTECLPDQNELFRTVYNTMVEVNNRYAKRYYNLSKQISESSRPLLITEGKTDWKHIKSAIKALKIDDFPGEFLEFEDNMGDNTLLRLLQDMVKVSPARMIIGIFDRDNPQILAELLADGSNIHEFLEHKVYGVVLPLKNQEIYGETISIEHYYKKDDLLKTDDNGRRLFLGSEFYKSGNSKDGKYQTKFSGIAHKVANNGIIDEKVFITEDLEQANSVALSKGKFTELIYKGEQFAHEFDFSSFKELIQILKDLCANKED